ncbi:MAG: TonB-dependent receptor [Bdellovibrionales bacterium]|nr:TonB-dependent receptor [Bdellovibrionales bacterium]
MNSKYLLTLLFIASLPRTVCAEEEHTPDDGHTVREHEIHDLTEIRISADPFNPSLLEYSSPVTVVEKKKLVEQSEPTIGETLSKEPGVSSTYYGPGASRPIIRGNSGERVRILKNGVGTLDASGISEDHAVAANPLAAQSVEILRGPETLLYGSTAVGGVVNITDNSIPEYAIGKDATGALDLRLGTADKETSWAALLEGQADKINWHTEAFYLDTDDIRIPGNAESEQLMQLEEASGEEHEEEGSSGTLENSAVRSSGATVGGSYIWDKGFVGIAVNSFRTRYGVPGHEHEEEGEGDEAEGHEHEEEEGGVRIDMEQLRVDLRGRVDDVSDQIESVKFKLGVSDYEHDELEEDIVATTFKNKGIEGRLEVLHAPAAQLEGVIGLQAISSTLEATGEESFLPKTDTIAPAVFIFEELPLGDQWALQFGGRSEYVAHDPETFSSNEFFPFSLSLGTTWDPTGRNNYTMGLSLAYTQRAPAVSELYADGAHLARGIFEIGDSSIDNEESYGAELTFKKNTGFVTGSSALFVQDYGNYINLSATGAEEDGLPVYVYNEVEALFYGFELETAFHLHELFDLFQHDLDLNAQFDYVRAKETSGDEEDLPRIPPFKTVVGLEYAFKEMFSAAVEGVFVAEQDKVSQFELPTDSYQLLNASLGFSPKLNSDRYGLTFYVRGTNLTDEEARVHSSFLKDVAPLRGRSVLFGVRGTF